MLKKSSLLWQVVIAFILALIVGAFSSPGALHIKIFSLLGQLFLNSLTLLAIPLVATSIIQGMNQMGRDDSFAGLGAKTFFFYIFTTLLAVLTGVVCVNLIQPGLQLVQEGAGPALSQTFKTPDSPMEVIRHLFLKLIPANVFEAASGGNILGIVFFSLLFGLALSKIESEASTLVSKLVKGLFYALMKMTHFFIRIMPFGVFCLVAEATAAQGMQSFLPLLSFFFTVLLGLIVFALIVIPILFKLLGLSPLRHLRAMAPALMTAFSTSSSAATLPITIDCVEKRAGVSNRICSFVVPLGTSVNLSGSALYECVAVLFIAHVYGVHLSFLHQVMVVFLALFTSMGVAGIPSGSLVAILVILHSLGLPAAGLALVVPVDRFLDMCRTAVNVLSDTSCAVLVAHTEGEKVLQKI